MAPPFKNEKIMVWESQEEDMYIDTDKALKSNMWIHFVFIYDFIFTLIKKKKIWNVPFHKRQRVALSKMERSVLGKRSFHLQYDSFQIGNETNLFGKEMWCFITKKVAFSEPFRFKFFLSVFQIKYFCM